MLGPKLVGRYKSGIAANITISLIAGTVVGFVYRNVICKPEIDEREAYFRESKGSRERIGINL